MKKTLKNSDLSYNLYYLKDFGKIEDQLDFLDSLNLHDVQFVQSSDDSEYCVMTEYHVSNNKIESRLIKIFPSLDGYPKHFRYPVVDLYLWLHRKFSLVHSVLIFKNKSLCEEDHSDGEEATAPVVD